MLDFAPHVRASSPLHHGLRTPISKTQGLKKFNWKSFNHSFVHLIHWVEPLYMGSYKVNLPIRTDVGLNFNKRNN